MPPKRSKDPTPAGARESALRVLARREHSAAELKEKLRRRGHGEDTAAGIVENLAAAGWQSDARYAEMLVRSRAQQGYGSQRIEAELAAAGIPDPEISSAMAAAERDWRALAVEIHARKFKAPPRNAAEWQKQYRFLAGRGFTADQIRAAVKGRGRPTEE